MEKEYEQSKEIIENIIKYIPESIKNDELKLFIYVYVKVASMLSEDFEAKTITESNLTGYDKERAYDSIVEPASDIRCLVRKKALSEGFAKVLSIILSKLNIKTIILNTGNDYFNQVCINGNWYNCDLSDEWNCIKYNFPLKKFLFSNKGLKTIPINSKNICSKNYFETETEKYELDSLINETKELVEEVNKKEIEENTKKMLNGKISTEDLFVACQVAKDYIVIEPFIQYETFGESLNNIIINPKRTLVIRVKYGNGYVYKLIPSLKEIDPVDYSSSYRTQGSSGGNVYYGFNNGLFNTGITMLNRELREEYKRNMNKYGYLICFKDYIKRKLGLNIDEISIHDARVLNAFTNIIQARTFLLSEYEDDAKKQLDKKVYLKKKNK